MVLYIMDFMNLKLGNLFMFLFHHLLQVMQGEKQLQHRNESVIIQSKNMVLTNMYIVTQIQYIVYLKIVMN